MNDLQIAILELEEKFKTQSCRFCLTPDKHIKYHLISEKLKKCLLYCTGITLNQEDGLPNQICTNCLSSLIIAYKFKKLCLLTEKICKNLQTNKKKVKLHDELSTEAIDDTYGLEEDHVDNENSIKEDHINKNQDDEIYVTENQDNENNGNIDHNKNNHVTYLIYDPGIQDNGTDSTEKQIVNKDGGMENLNVELDSGLETKDSIEGPPKRKSDEGNTKVVGGSKQLVFGPFSKRKLQCMKLLCKWCNMKFDTKQEAAVHRHTVHKQGLTCKFCGKTFTRHSAHYLHVKSHLPPTLQCDHCDFRTALKQNMIVHLRTHNGDISTNLKLDRALSRTCT
ncbi:jg3173, partial [Pararge aegeria aegeria]